MMLKSFPRIIFAGLRGGSGKTTISLGVISALRNKRGLSITPFKKGPDFIDSGWLSLAAQRPCYNLDPFLVSKERVYESFTSHFNGDIAIIEGNRGLYDGMDVDGSYSTAELSKLITAPVVLIVDCTKMTRTVAAIVLGCMNFDKEVQIRGVILNQLSGLRHESVAKGAIEKYCSIPVIGAIPRLRSGEFPERHMGLIPYQEHFDTEKALCFAEEIATKYIDLDKLIDIANDTSLLNFNLRVSDPISPDVRIGVIRDSAFQFYYPENLEELQKNGAEIIQINAMKDEKLPDIDALYIGGGFPETNAIKLAENQSFIRSLKKAAEDGLPVYAECGGLMFLGDYIMVKDERFPMVGLFPIGFRMKQKPQAHGYTVLEVQNDNPFYPVGTVIHGHEFHYSSVEGFESVRKDKKDYSFAFKMKRGTGIIDAYDGICYKNVLASYTHIHALGVEGWAIGLIKKAREFKNKKINRG